MNPDYSSQMVVIYPFLHNMQDAMRGQFLREVKRAFVQNFSFIWTGCYNMDRELNPNIYR